MGRSFIHLFLMSVLILGLYLFGKTKEYFLLYFPHNIHVKEIKAQSGDSIITQNETAIIPVNYNGHVDFRSMDPERRKQKFIEYLLPAIVITREQLLDDLHHVEFIEMMMKENRKISSNDSVFLSSMKLKYWTDSISELKKRIYPHPVSLALTQAVLESGWGTSSISKMGNNLFGVLSFSSEESRIKMKLNNSEDDIYLRSYHDVIESVEHYYLLISRISSYKKFREKRWEGASANQLVKFLDSYHESDDYETLANSIIRSNDLTRYDLSSIAAVYRKNVTLYSFLTQH